MPNLPAAIGAGRDGAVRRRAWTRRRRATAAGLVAPLGAVEWIDREELFDAVTALSGCGPGFLFRFVEALAEAGAALGLPADQAVRLALATVDGIGGDGGMPPTSRRRCWPIASPAPAAARARGSTCSTRAMR